MALSDPHRFAPGSVLWSVTDAGVSINGLPPVGTGGQPETARRVLDWFGADITRAATIHSVPAALLVAIICNESAGGQPNRALVCAARREEPGFTSDADTPARVSTGCCQTLLSTARVALGQPELTSAELCDPGTSILAAAAYIASQKRLTGFDPVLVAAAYNSGGLHLEPTTSRDGAPCGTTNRWGLRCFPLGSGVYIDRFVRWFNDACAVERAAAG